MSGDSVAIDTSWAIGLMEGDVRFARTLAQFSRFFLPVTALGEVLFGALNSAKVKDNLQRVDVLLTDCILLPVDEMVARHYCEIRLSLKKKGRPIPENDLWIAACCLAQNLPLATLDAHFNDIDGLTVIAASA